MPGRDDDWLALLQAPTALRPALPARPAPTVSVLVPAYQAAATLAAAVDSALAQRPAPHEVVVSDDGSTDDVEGALRPFGGRVRLVRGPNAGLATARNRAAATATGELLALLDADDVWLPGRVAALSAAAAARPDLAILTTDATVVREGVVVEPSYYANRSFEVTDQPTALLRSNFIFGAGAVRAEAFRAVGGYAASARWAEDWDLWLRLVLRGARAGLVRAPLYEYRRSAGSLTAQRLPLALGALTALEGARELVDDDLRRRVLAGSLAEWRYRAAVAAARAGDPRRLALSRGALADPALSPSRRLRAAAAAVVPALLLRRSDR